MNDVNKMIEESIMAENRIDSLSPAPPVDPSRVGLPAASPTGTPVLPPQVAPWAAVVVAIAAMVPMIPGLPPMATTVAGIIVALGAALGIVSPGARR